MVFEKWEVAVLGLSQAGRLPGWRYCLRERSMYLTEALKGKEDESMKE